MLKSIIITTALLVALPTFAARPGDELVQPGKQGNKIARLQCGKRVLITNVVPYPAGCVVIKESSDNSNKISITPTK